MPMKVGLLGCGFIGSTIAGAIRAKKSDLELVSAFDSDPQKCSSLGFRPCSFDEFLASDFDIAVECASQEAVKAYGTIGEINGRLYQSINLNTLDYITGLPVIVDAVPLGSKSSVGNC